MSIPVVCNYLILILVSAGSLTMITRGLCGESKTNEYGAGDVLTGCIVAVMIGFAVYGLWTR